MAGIKKLRKIQLGRETTAGTEVDATTIWRGTGVIEDDLEVIFPEEDIGYKSGVDRTYIPKKAALLELEDTPATYEQVAHLLEMGIETVEASADGSGSGYIYSYPFATTTDTASTKTYTIEGGDNTQEEQFLYGFCTEFHLSGTANEAVMMGGTVVGRTVDTGTYTSTTPLPTVEEILFNKGKLYIDDADGTMGTTQAQNTWREFDLSVTTGWQPVYTGDGELYFSFNKNVGAEIELTVTLEHDSTARAEVSNWRTETARQIRMSFTGSTFTTAGTSYTNKTLNVDLVGKWEDFEPLGDADGNDTITGTFRARYNSTAAAFATITLVNDLSAVQ